MGAVTNRIGGAINAVESFFDRLKLGYKWRYNRWQHLQVQAYRGYGTQEKLHLRGRVLDDHDIDPPQEGQPAWKNALNTLRRIETDEVPGARVQVQFQDQELEAETDDDGFFSFVIEPEQPPQADRVWHDVKINLLNPPPRTSEEGHATGHVEVPPADAEFGVISDLDDTVVRTGATNLFQMVRVVLLNNARTRTPFEGVGALYHALRKGPDNRGHNPIFYLSSSPWNLYEMFEHFFEAHGIPPGPIFLKDYGFTRKKLFTAGHRSHKLDHIRLLFETYPDLSFVLVGDSGQEDPEIYQEAVATYGADRVEAIYIRDVTPENRNARDEKVEAIAQDVREQGVPMVLAPDSVAAARHAAHHGLIAEQAVDEVREDKQHERETKEEPGRLEKMLGG